MSELWAVRLYNPAGARVCDCGVSLDGVAPDNPRRWRGPRGPSARMGGRDILISAASMIVAGWLMSYVPDWLWMIAGALMALFVIGYLIWCRLAGRRP